MTKNYRVKSKFRFTCFVLVVLFAVTFLFNTYIGTYNAAALTAKDYIEIEVVDGDTLWTIADLYMPDDMDTRQAVHILIDENKIDNTIQAGQIIKVPQYI